jgi:leucyl-tRNA synthetase
VQVNGKVRGTVTLAADAKEDEALAAARANPRIAKWLGAAEPRKVIYVPGKVLNLVIPDARSGRGPD